MKNASIDYHQKYTYTDLLFRNVKFYFRKIYFFMSGALKHEKKRPKYVANIQLTIFYLRQFTQSLTQTRKKKT